MSEFRLTSAQGQQRRSLYISHDTTCKAGHDVHHHHHITRRADVAFLCAKLRTNQPGGELTLLREVELILPPRNLSHAALGVWTRLPQRNPRPPHCTWYTFAGLALCKYQVLHGRLCHYWMRAWLMAFMCVVLGAGDSEKTCVPSNSARNVRLTDGGCGERERLCLV